MKRILKVVIPVAILASVVLIVVFSAPKPTPKPDFRISNVYGEIQGPEKMPRWQAFVIIFDVENNGTSVAHHVNGTARYLENGEWVTVNWRLDKEPNMLDINEKVRRSFAVFSFCSVVPSEEFVITVTCEEEVLREFNVTID